MMKKRSLLILIIAILFIQVRSFGQWKNEVHKPGIESVVCHKKGFPLNPPIILLNSGEQIHFSFDDLDDNENAIYYYSIIHCSSDWNSSNLYMQDYLDGFQQNEVYNYKFSRNTLQDYTHFWIDLPNDEVKFKSSGNYILNIFEGMDQEKLVLSQRFMIYENMASVDIKVKSASVVAERDYKQEVDFTVRTGGVQVYNPYDEIKITLLQNMRWDNAITDLQPKFIKGNELVYDFDEKSSFEGGNEYRNFDIKDLRYQSDRIAAINEDSSRVRIFLHPDHKRSFSRYSSMEDINGSYMITKDHSIDSDIEADYAWVYFTLPFDFPVHQAELYVSGMFSNYEFSPKYKMEYDFDKKAYKKKLFLKQGYYNYAYFYLDNNSESGLITYIEGSHYQTNNDYLVLVYYKDSSLMHDRLIAAKFAQAHL